jgi:isopenicillin N synthase-like dioxygenase
MLQVPVIDIGPLVNGRGDIASTARAIDASCREAGFFYVVGHDVDPQLQGRLEDLSRQFFALADSEKAEIAMTRGGPAWRGWFPVGGELTSSVPDVKEGIYFGAELPADHPAVTTHTPLHGSNLFPRRPPELRDTVLAYMDAMTRLGQAVLAGAALGLGLERTWFLDHLTTDPLTLFRIFHYPPTIPQDERWGVGEHTDYGLLTILAQDANRGLQVRSPAGWIDAEPLPGSFVCNLGDMLERLTGGLYRSTPHRVRNASGADRLSFPFFLDPSWDAVVDRLPIVDRPEDDEGAAERWDRTSVHGFTGTYGDYILGKVAKVFPDLAGAVTQGARR